METMTKLEIVNGALNDCQSSLQTSYDFICNTNDTSVSSKERRKIMEKINISLTILNLMKEGASK